MSTYSSTLDAYLSRAENKEADLAEKIDRPQPTVNRYRRGKRFPDAETARLIETATEGEVPFAIWQADFLDRAGIGQAA